MIARSWKIHVLTAPSQGKSTRRYITTFYAGSKIHEFAGLHTNTLVFTPIRWSFHELEESVFKVSFDEVAVYALQLVLHSAGMQIDNWEAQKKREHAASRNLEMQWKLLHRYQLEITSPVSTQAPMQIPYTGNNFNAGIITPRIFKY